jgi:Arc/MetJ-type ribon-helix-helix transcriptional regulator
MSVPVTARLEEQVVEAVDRAVAAGLAPTRAAVISRAVDEWLARHGEDAIAESYRRRYAELDPEHDDLVARLAAFTAAACLANENR